MSRTSHRVSRPLIGLLVVVIALGTYFTIHKLHAARAQEAHAAVPVLSVIDPAPSLRPAATQSAIVARTAPPAPSEPVDPPLESSALVTQTPTERARPDKASPDSSSAKPSSWDSLPVDHVSDAPPAPPATEPSADDIGKGDNAARAQEGSSAPAQGNPAPAKSDAGAPAVASIDDVHPAIVAPQLSGLNALADAKAKADAGDLIPARQLLNDALIRGSLSEPDADAARKQIEQINQTLVFSARRFPDDPWGGTYQVAGGQRLGSIAAKNSVSWELLARINNVTPRKLRSGQYIKIFKGPFHAVVTKHLFRLDIYLGAPGGSGSLFIRSFPVGLGKDNSTPTGLWLCKAGDKIRNPRYYPPRGGDILAPNDPKNPLGGYWIALEGLDGQALGKESYGIHGTIEPQSIGQMSSMGCIRLRTEDISWVFDLLVDGKSKVVIKE